MLIILSAACGKACLLPMVVWCSFAAYLNAERADIFSRADN